MSRPAPLRSVNVVARHAALGAFAVVSLVASVLTAARPAAAHELTPVVLALDEVASDEYEVTFTVPEEIGRDRLAPVLPPGATALGPPLWEHVGDLEVARFRAKVPGGVVGRPLDVSASEGDPARLAREVLVRVTLRDGRALTGRLVPHRQPYLAPPAPSRSAVARAYVRLGIEHILLGFDHLAFVLALLLLVRSPRALIATVTAFTLAHSLTLALATLGWVRLPGPPVEASIALSIVFVARELLRARRGRPGLTARRPWLVAFAFGLLHGLGFAGALAQLGLPDREIPLALFTFNVGVELGQLAFVAAALAIARVARPLWARHAARLQPLTAYAIGALAACWCLQRIATFVR